MCKIKSWVVDQKKHVRYYHDWNDKEVTTFYFTSFLQTEIVLSRQLRVKSQPVKRQVQITWHPVKACYEGAACPFKRSVRYNLIVWVRCVCVYLCEHVRFGVKAFWAVRFMMLIREIINLSLILLLKLHLLSDLIFSLLMSTDRGAE